MFLNDYITTTWVKRPSGPQVCGQLSEDRSGQITMPKVGIGAPTNAPEMGRHTCICWPYCCRGKRVCGHPCPACVRRQAKATQAWHVPDVPGMIFALWAEFEADNHTGNSYWPYAQKCTDPLVVSLSCSCVVALTAICNVHVYLTPANQNVIIKYCVPRSIYI